MLGFATFVFIYYTVWTFFIVSYTSSSLRKLSFIKSNTVSFLQPFLDDESPVRSFFPPREWAIRLPVIGLLVFLAIVGSFVGVMLIQAESEEEGAAARRKREQEQEQEQMSSSGFGYERVAGGGESEEENESWVGSTLGSKQCTFHWRDGEKGRDQGHFHFHKQGRIPISLAVLFSGKT